MSAKETLKRNKTKVQEVLCGDYRFILNKVQEKELITLREYNNLRDINKEDVEGHVVKLVDKMMNKGEETCQHFLDLLQTDEVTGTYPDLKNIQLRDIRVVTEPVQVTAPYCGDMVPESKRQKKEELYELKSHPVGFCLIINNEEFIGGKPRKGTNKDADSLAEVFSWLGFRVLMCKDQTRDQMKETLQCFASLPDDVQLQGLSLQEWSGSCFTAPQQIIEHDISRYFKATKESPLTGKPKMFLIQACQGREIQQKVSLKVVEEDSLTIPEEADVLVALATVEDHQSFRNPIEGSWFVQSVCEQLKEQCPRGEDITSILLRVNDQVGQKEGSIRLDEKFVPVKQAPEVRFTLRKKLVLSPHSLWSTTTPANRAGL
ncbi:hypothetical protein CHARACLAT_011372 [Characodon lateralis]|uniref:Uncharacterized protein n=1 Tax=Characodon lateralis TaxID=208331 RepID=A0ABU7ETZ8_9TELE|nr:hypothetical protein [Characodon lateralis]